MHSVRFMLRQSALRKCWTQLRGASTVAPQYSADSGAAAALLSPRGNASNVKLTLGYNIFTMDENKSSKKSLEGETNVKRAVNQSNPSDVSSRPTFSPSPRCCFRSSSQKTLANPKRMKKIVGSRPFFKNNQTNKIIAP